MGREVCRATSSAPSCHVGLTVFYLKRYLGPVPHDASYYSKCLLGGVLACGTTHAGITPLDVTKCNMQVRGAPLSGNAFVL